MVLESNELILRWDSGAVFPFDAGALCLELTTTGGVGDYARYEYLPTPDDFAAWLATSRLHLPGARIAAGDLATARGLRTAIWAAAHARIAGQPPPPPAVATINELAAHPPPVPQLAGDRREWARETTGTQVLSAIARDAVDLFGGPFTGRIRECAAADCGLVFVDLSRPGKRRWCAMERCGNRAKQRTRRR
jgi:predicted RNA-binding Zn ribbon-like protein